MKNRYVVMHDMRKGTWVHDNLKNRKVTSSVLPQRRGDFDSWVLDLHYWCEKNNRDHNDQDDLGEREALLVRIKHKVKNLKTEDLYRVHSLVEEILYNGK